MNPHHTARALALVSIAVFVAWCIADVFFVTVPFWVDEWRIIYNLKTRSVTGLWAPLDFMQQAPRAYLSVLKVAGAAGDYGYTALRLPALLTSSASVWLAWRLMQRLYGAGNWRQYLFPLILISSVPFTKYAVQVKQYPADILMGLVALWQGLELWRMLRGDAASRSRQALIAVSFLAAPFFSYTYPIALIPVFVTVAVLWLRERRPAYLSTPGTARIAAGAVIACAAVAAAWWLDTRHAVADPQMRSYWRDRLWWDMAAAEKFRTIYTVFSQIGAGDFFVPLFGVLGLAAFGWSALQWARLRSVAVGADVAVFMRPYAVLSIGAAWVLFALGKLPLGEARLNTFLTPAIAWMLVDFLGYLGRGAGRRKWMTATGAALTVLLYAGTAGNILTTIAAEYTDARWPTKRRIYSTIGRAIQTARTNHLPILATPRIAFPEEAHDNVPFPEKMPGDWVLKTHPDYRFSDNIPVYRLRAVEDAAGVLRSLPTGHTAAVVCGGDTAFVLRHR